MRGMADPRDASSSKPKETSEERKKRKERKKKKKEKRDRERRVKKEKRKEAGNDERSSLPPMLSRASHLVNPLPKLGAKLEQDKRAAQEQFRLNQRENEERKRQQREMEKMAMLGSEEMERRSNYLKKQRDLLIQKKANERKVQLEEYESRRKKTNVTAKQEYLDAKRLKDSMSSSKKSDQGDDEKGNGLQKKEKKGKKEMTAAQKKRRDMMKSLGMQMKTDLVHKEEQRINDVQIEQYSALDRQLRLAENQRKDRQRKNSEMMDQMRQDKLIRAMNVQSSAFANRIIHNEKDFSFKESD